MILCTVTCLSCQSQEKTELEKVDFTTNYKEILKGTKIKTEAREIVTTLPVASTNEVDKFNFGTVNFSNSNENDIKSATVGILINNTTERSSKGIKIEVEDTDTSNRLFTYLKSQYKTPKTLSPIPQKNNDGYILGNSAYSWSLRDKTIVLVQYYEYTDKKPTVSSTLYVLDNKVLMPDAQGSVASHVIKTFTP